jgi:hypothetical protein
MRRRKFQMGGDVDPMEAANASMESQDIARSMAAGPKNETPKAAPKNRVVSKKELEDSGLSLRDYLNRERGLKRRAEKDPTAGDSPDKAAQEAADAIDPGRDMRTPRRYNSIMERSPQERDDMLKLGLQRQAAEKAMKDFKAKKAAGMKSGGSVTSASKRADGIATKGKTRCKIC